MTLMFIRVFAGFLAGLMLGILATRRAYKKTTSSGVGDELVPNQNSSSAATAQR